MEQGVVVQEKVMQMVRSWWLVAACMLLGAAAGWGIGRGQAPVYEAAAEITVSIDFTRTGALTDAEEDFAVGVVGDLIQSDAVFETVFQQAANSELDRETLRQSLSADRYFNFWRMRARSKNPDQAAALANAWGQAAYTALSETVLHAQTAYQWETYLDGLTGCVGQSVGVEPAPAECRQWELDELQNEIQRVGQILRAEKDAAQGIVPWSAYSEVRQAEVPTSPARGTTAVLMVCGALLGALAGIAWVWGVAGKAAQRGQTRG